MSAYLVVRRWRSLADAEAYVERLRVAGQPDDVSWDHTHVAEHDAGWLTSFCVYQASSAEALREHIAALGGFELRGIHPITGDLVDGRLAPR